MLTLSDKLAPTEKSNIKPQSIAIAIILLNASITMTNKNEDKGFLAHTLRASKELKGILLINKKKRIIKIQH
jgi:hypothetical protein